MGNKEISCGLKSSILSKLYYLHILVEDLFPFKDMIVVKTYICKWDYSLVPLGLVYKYQNIKPILVQA